MTIRGICVIFTFTVGLIGVVNVHACAEPDPIEESFQRELNHQAPPAKAIRRHEVSKDSLYKLVNKPLQSKPRVQNAAVAKGGE